MDEQLDTAAEITEDAPVIERILFFPEPCTRLEGEECTRCAAVCPQHAISFAESGMPTIDAGACSCCGICIGVCDSFSSSRITTVDHANRMQRHAQDGKLYLCCKEDLFEGLEPAKNVIALNCLSSLSPEFIAYLFSTGIELVLCHDLSYCEGCPVGGAFGGALWQRAFKLAQEWTGKQLESSEVIPEVEHFTEKMSAPDRRTLFTGAIGAVGEVASGEYRARKSSVVEQFLARREQMRAQTQAIAGESLYLDEDSRKQSQESRFSRKILLEKALENDPLIAERMKG
ncbi:MAG: hypothetical protein Q4C36_05515 [Coriobacteriia bacterium]|nr:hypothetical protein [Coriobacteriia bacterium]